MRGDRAALGARIKRSLAAHADQERKDRELEIEALCTRWPDLSAERVAELYEWAVRRLSAQYPLAPPLTAIVSLIEQVHPEVGREMQAEVKPTAPPVSTAEAPEPEPPEPEPRLPGDLTWSRIETTYRQLAKQKPGFGRRRHKPDEPSRPELARALMTSPASLKRACAAAGRGTRWPPAGL